MKIETYMLIVKADGNNARKVCEDLEAQTFIGLHDVRDILHKENIKEFVIMPITDFMDEVNNQECQDFSESFISYFYTIKI